MIHVIAFDADDTLWENEILYSETKRSFAELLAGYSPPQRTIDLLDRTEIHNLQFYGYGIKSFALSMIETAVEVTGGAVKGAEIQEIIQLIKGILSAEVRLFEQVDSTIAELAVSHQLMLITKGDLFEQDRKVRLSGIAAYFNQIEIVSEKSESGYRNLLNKHGIEAEQFLMVGNSLRSDILPVVAIGAQAVYIPYADTWEHENRIDEAYDEDSYHRLESITQLPGLLRRLNGS
jgi:putative hydrolase of the HAD superfamily